MTDLQTREAAVREERHWVRVTHACNNRCLFCLDSENARGAGPHVPDARIEADIRRGRERGAERLILSGGEASIHPRFLDFVRLGRELGYTWIQTVSNGRMFSYPHFVKAAVKAGLAEVTVSIHGHEAALHDRLTGIPGSFEQAVAGVTNLRRVRGFVVNVDVVLNALNVPHLRALMERFIALGVHEFDLLHLVPFGRAWGQGRDVLAYDPVEMAGHLKRAFELRRRHDLVIWTNRLPAPYLEGEEDLIQDPHKLHDDVNGRREMFARLVAEGVPLDCAGERCAYCHLDPFCGGLVELVRQWREGDAPALRARVDTPPDLLDVARARFGADKPLWVEIGDGGPLPAARPEGWLYTGRDPARLRALLATGAPVRVYATRALLEAGPWPAGAQALVPTAEYLGDLAPQLPDRATLGGLRALDLPPCLGGQGRAVFRDAFPLALVDPATLRLDPVAYTDHYVRERYRVHSLRCQGCAARAVCDGLHIHHARHEGLGVLTPLPPAGAPAPEKDR